MIKIICQAINYGDMIELFYDTKLKQYIFIKNGKKKIIKEC